MNSSPSDGRETPNADRPPAVWAQGKFVVASDFSTFPPRCVGCNGTEDLHWKSHALKWMPAHMLLLRRHQWRLFGGQREASIQVATCRHCRRKVVMQRWGTATIAAGGCAAVAGGVLIQKYFGIIGIARFFTALYHGTVVGRLFVVTGIKDGTITLKGLHPDFMAALDPR